MEKEIIYNSNLHFEHVQWRRELFFWEDELKTFKNRLSELVMRYTSKEVMVQLEHFQNQIILHGGKIDDLLEDIEKHESQIAGQSMAGKDVLDTVLVKKHLEFRDRMETQRQLYADLKKDFFRFLTKYM
ncbi:MAG: hypothetical protein KJP26_00600 [Maribacter sp.]|nr:hypothetical protein [Maribacter sp.]NNK19374.1 hypothetical protein [Maribacter sp.]